MNAYSNVLSFHRALGKFGPPKPVPFPQYCTLLYSNSNMSAAPAWGPPALIASLRPVKVRFAYSIVNDPGGVPVARAGSQTRIYSKFRLFDFFNINKPIHKRTTHYPVTVIPCLVVYYNLACHVVIRESSRSLGGWRMGKRIQLKCASEAPNQHYSNQ